MSRQVCFSPEHKELLNKMTEFALSDREHFRLSAAEAYRKFSSHDRSTVGKLAAGDTNGYTLLGQWHSSLRPFAGDLSANQAKPAFTKDIAKYLILDTQMAERKVKELVSARQQEAREAFLYRLYPSPVDSRKDKYARSHNHARNLLLQPEEEIESLKERYTTFLLHQTVATAQHVPVADAHVSWFRRKLTLRHIAKERKKLSGNERNRLNEIDQRLHQLMASHDGMLGDLLTKDWDLIVVISLRNKYEKQLRALSPDEIRSPLKRLTVFEKITKQFRDEQIDRLARSHPNRDSLVAVRQFAEATDALLLRIFDLSNEQKNQLLVLTKEARELQKERSTLIEGRTRRQQILQNNTAQ